jgi:omega-hydroxy-beta-dihydromenaquinone-9 sulfotransferase
MAITTARPAPSLFSRIDRLRSRLAARLGIRVWYGIGIETWAPLLLRYGHTVSPWQLPRLVLFTLLSALNSFCGLLTRLLFGARIGEVRLHPAPIFVLGHWRTGTTYLHELLASDPRFIYPRGYQCGAPRLFLLLETTFRPFLNFALPQHRPMDAMRFDLERAQEDEYALLGLIGHSNMRSFIFPAAGPQDADYLSLRKLDDRARQCWTDNWIYFLKSVAIRHGDDQRFILKSPQHTARVRTILQVFPQAKVVHLVRNPLDIYASSVRTWKALCDTQGLQRPGAADGWIPENVLSTFQEMHRCFEADRHLIPRANLIDVRYEELTADPMQTLQQIYAQFGLGNPRDCAAIAERISESAHYRRNAHRLSASELHSVAVRWADFTQRYGYGDAVAEAMARHGS